MDIKSEECLIDRLRYPSVVGKSRALVKRDVRNRIDSECECLSKGHTPETADIQSVESDWNARKTIQWCEKLNVCETP